MEVPIGVIIAVISALATGIGILYKQNITQQQITEKLLGETKELMGGLTELIRTANSLMVEVKDVMIICKGDKDANDGN